MNRKKLSIRTLLIVVLGLIITCCASVNSNMPDGGRYDEEPPKVVSCDPGDKAVHNTKKKFSILFDEYIKLENANEKVVVSPPQIEAPNIRAVGKKVKIDLYDTLQANTTYTIDFSDAIVDNNEGNPMGQYAYSFSTGDAIDTMEVAGTVLNAADLEPIKGMLVGLYPADSTYDDTLFTTKPFLRVSRTNGSGKFCIKGVANGNYRVFALQDMDGNYQFSQKSEQLAFDSTIVSTTSRPDLRPDTVWTADSTIEKILMVPYIHYFPDNLVLKAFLEEGQDMHRLKEERPTPDHFTLYFTAPQDSMPLIKGISFDADKSLIPEPSLHNDTITYWVRDTLASNQETLSFTMTYFDTDTLGVPQLRTDTLELTAKLSHEKIEKKRLQDSAEWQKEHEKKVKKGKEAADEENPYEVTYMDVQAKPSGSIDPNQNITFTFSEPIERIDTTMLHFGMKVDSNYVDKPFLFLPVEGQIRQYRLYAEWESKAQYKFEADSLSILGALGHYARPLKQEIRVKSDDEFGSLFVHLINPDEGCIVQLLNKSDKAVAQVPAEKGRADFFYLKPGDYYLRLFIDKNGNGKWDTGEYASKLQPEEVFYYPRPIPVKAKWDIEQDWNYRSIDTAKQKPKEITKQKPDKEKNIKNRNWEREKEMRGEKKKQN